MSRQDCTFGVVDDVGQSSALPKNVLDLQYSVSFRNQSASKASRVEIRGQFRTFHPCKNYGRVGETSEYFFKFNLGPNSDILLPRRAGMLDV